MASEESTTNIPVESEDDTVIIPQSASTSADTKFSIDEKNDDSNSLQEETINTDIQKGINTDINGDGTTTNVANGSNEETISSTPEQPTQTNNNTSIATDKLSTDGTTTDDLLASPPRLDTVESSPPNSPPKLSSVSSSSSPSSTAKPTLKQKPQSRTPPTKSNTAQQSTQPKQQRQSITPPKTKVTAKVEANDKQSEPAETVVTSPSLFGPFVDPLINSDWNPFSDDNNEGNGERFAVDDDIKEQSTSQRINVANGGEGTSSGGLKRSSSSQQQQQQQTDKQTSEVEINSLRQIFDSEYERALEDQEISWRARYGATRLSFIMSTLLMIIYLWLGCMFYRSEAGWSIPDALLFTVYTVTTVGYGGPMPLPNTAAFHGFTSLYILVGISLVTVLGAHTYQLITLETTKLRTSPRRRRKGNNGNNDVDDEQSDVSGQGGEGMVQEIDKYREQFMTELEDLVKERPCIDATIVKIKEFQLYLRTTKTGQCLAVVLPFLGMIFLGAIVVGTIEEWSPLESIYWSIVTLTTVGYGDYVPTKNSSVWFCTLFFIPSALFFLSFFLAHVAKAYIRLHAIHVTRLERKMRRESERRRMEAERDEKARRIEEAAAAIENAAKSSNEGQGSIAIPTKATYSPGGTKIANEDVEEGFATIISYAEDQDLSPRGSPTKSSGLFGDEAGNFDPDHNNDDPDSSPAQRYRENVIRNKDAAPDAHSNRAVTFAEAHQSLLNRHSSSSTKLDEFANESQQQQSTTNKPSLDVRLRVQARLARIIAEEVAGYQTGVIIKGSTVSLTIGSLRDTSEKWKIPPQAWKAFRAVAFRSLLFVGERELISDGGDALLRLNVVEFHQIFSPMLAAMGDGSSMESWLAATNILADVELRGGSKYGKAKPVFTGTFT